VCVKVAVVYEGTRSSQHLFVATSVKVYELVIAMCEVEAYL